jgi:outer membrane protein assembly factor BamB
MRRRLLLLAATAVLAAAPAPAQTITTVAGTGVPAFSPDGSPAATSSLAFATDGVANVVFDSDGNMTFSESRACRVRRIVRKTGLLETVAGSGVCGYSGDGGPAKEARLKAPAEIAFDAKGNLFVADAGNNLVRRVDGKTGVITTVAGNRSANYEGEGVATAVPIGRPSGLVFDRKGRLLISEVFGSRIRRLDFETGKTETIAGKNELVFTGGPALETGFAWPNSPRFDRNGALFFAASGNNQILRLDPRGEILSAFAGNGNVGLAGDGGPAARAVLNQPAALAVDGGGNVFIADTANNVIRRVDAKTGTITRVAGTGDEAFTGDGGPAAAAALADPLGLGLDGKGNLYVVDARNYRIRKIEGVAR